MISTARADRFRKLASAFHEIKAERDDALRQNLTDIFVSNNATKAIRGTNKFILIGRKGSGKTASVFDFIEDTKDYYNIHLAIDSDAEPHWLVYNFYFKQFAEADDKVRARLSQIGPLSAGDGRDLTDIFDAVSLFTLAWTVSIQVCIANAIVMDTRTFDSTQFRTQRSKIRQYLEKQFGITSDPKTQIGDSINLIFTAVCEVIQAKIEDFIKSKTPSLGVLLSQIKKWAQGTPTSRIVPNEIDQIIRDLLKDSRIKVLVSMDKYDDLVDEIIKQINTRKSIQDRFKGQAITPGFQGTIRLSMLHLQQNMLKGLLLASRKLREDSDYRNVHFALAIPDDRFLELELREGAELNLSYVEKIQWSPPELVEFFVRRCSLVLRAEGIELDLNFTDCDKLKTMYHKIIETLEFPFATTHSRLNISEELIFYIIRHTLCRPRDLLRYFHEIFSSIHYKLENGLSVAENDFEDIVRKAVIKVSQAIINDELSLEYQVEYEQLGEVLQRFRNRGSVLYSNDLRSALRGAKLSNFLDEMRPSEIGERLYRLGLLGVRVLKPEKFDGAIRWQRQFTSFEFFYDERMSRFSIGRRADFRALDNRHAEGAVWVIHPMFFDYLRIQTDQDFIVNYMDWTTVQERYCSEYRPHAGNGGY